MLQKNTFKDSLVQGLYNEEYLADLLTYFNSDISNLENDKISDFMSILELISLANSEILVETLINLF